MVENNMLYQECPLCNQSPVVLAGDGLFRCNHCGLALKRRSLLGVFRKNHLGVERLGRGDYSLAEPALKRVTLPAERLKVVIGNVYSDEELARIAGGSLETIRPVRTVVAQILLEQLKETCYLQVNGIQLGVGRPLPPGAGYKPEQRVPWQEMEWKHQGNLFGTDKHLVLPSDAFTFVRLDRKLAGVQAFTDGVGVQRKGEAFATYFAGCLPHEAALVAAFVIGKLPALRE